jgi:hypothetical protein
MIQVKSQVSGCGIYDAQSSKEKLLEEGRLLKWFRLSPRSADVEFMTRKVALEVRVSVGGIAEDWTVRESNPGRGQYFSHPSISALGPIHPPIQWVLTAYYFKV